MKIDITIIIATYNRSACLIETLDSVLSQEFPVGVNYELIVVDNNSTDNTKLSVLSYESKFQGKLIYLFEPRQGKAFALNRAIAKSQGNIIVFTDDDVLVTHTWIKNIWECFNKNDCDGIGGKILPLFLPNTPQWIINNADLLNGPLVLFDFGTETKLYTKPMYEFFGANFAFKRKVFDDCGYFRTDIGMGKAIQGEDTEFVRRVHQSGKILYYCGSAVVNHKTLKRITLKYIAKWNIALGRYRVIIDDQRKIDPSLVLWQGIPRYLFKVLLNNLIQTIINIFNRRKFLEALITLSQNWGKAMEIRSINNN